MIPAGPLLSQLYDDLDASDDDKKRRVVRRLNLCYFDIAQQVSWASLRRTKTLTFNGSASGVILPANLAGIDAIYNSTNGFFSPREKAQVVISADASYRWAITSTTTAPLAIAKTGATVNKFASAITGISTDYTGEFIIFSDRMGIYELASQTALVETFLEETVQGGGYQIRPPGTKYIAAYNPDGTLFSGSVTMDYWTLPQPITDNSQVVLLPSTDALATFTTMRHIGLVNIDPKMLDRFRSEYALAFAKMLDANPAYITPNIPVGMGGTPATFAAQGT